AYPGRYGPPLWRHYRCSDLPRCARSAFGHEPAILVLLDRHIADGDRPGHAERDSRRPCAPRRKGAAMSAGEVMLRTEGLRKKFGALEVARDISFELPRGARHALIGPNGAGKTTLINLITGRLRPDS